MGNYISKINQDKRHYTWFKDTFSVAKRSQACLMQRRITTYWFWPRSSTRKL